MILGQSAATAGCLSLDENIAIQDLSFETLKTRLLNDGQVLDWERKVKSSLIPLNQIKGLVIDDTQAELKRPWKKSTIMAGVDLGYYHNVDLKDGSCTAAFSITLDPGSYEIQIAYIPNQNRATNVPVGVHT